LGIVRLLNMGSILLAIQFGLDLCFSFANPITKFCPLYTVLNKLMQETDPL